MRVWFGLAITAALVWAQAAGTVNDIVNLVRAALDHKQSDAQIARALHRVKPVESLDLHTVEELENLGAGARTLSELEHLRETSASLPATICSSRATDSTCRA